MKPPHPYLQGSLPRYENDDYVGPDTHPVSFYRDKTPDGVEYGPVRVTQGEDNSVDAFSVVIVRDKEEGYAYPNRSGILCLALRLACEHLEFLNGEPTWVEHEQGAPHVPPFVTLSARSCKWSIIPSAQETHTTVRQDRTLAPWRRWVFFWKTWIPYA